MRSGQVTDLDPTQATFPSIVIKMPRDNWTQDQLEIILKERWGLELSIQDPGDGVIYYVDEVGSHHHVSMRLKGLDELNIWYHGFQAEVEGDHNR